MQWHPNPIYYKVFPHSFIHKHIIDFKSFIAHQDFKLMEKMMMMITRRKAKENKSKDDDDDEQLMALVKAAAWAWFQHGSGSKEKSFQEFQLTRPEKVVTPSRFKLDAMRIVMENNNNDSSSESSSSEYHSLTLSPAQTDNLLLDAYEIDQISRQLDFLIESSSNDTRRHSRSSFASDRGHKKNFPPPPRASPGSEKLRKNPKKLNGSWMLRYGVPCSSIEGVVEPKLGAVCRSIEGVVEPRLLNRPGQRMHGSSNHQRKTHYK